MFINNTPMLDFITEAKRLTDALSSTTLSADDLRHTIKDCVMNDTNQNVWTNIPNRKRRFHMNAEKRAATNWNGTLKMLKLLAPCGVQANAQALDIINAKYGI